MNKQTETETDVKELSRIKELTREQMVQMLESICETVRLADCDGPGEATDGIYEIIDLFEHHGIPASFNAERDMDRDELDDEDDEDD